MFLEAQRKQNNTYFLILCFGRFGPHEGINEIRNININKKITNRFKNF